MGLRFVAAVGGPLPMERKSNGLSDRQARVLDAIAERLIPSDDGTPGAREANAAAYVRAALGGAYAEDLPAYAAGLDALDAAGFCELASERQDDLLRTVEREDAAFFALVRRHVIEGTFCDPAHGGNAGFVGWDLLGYPGVRREWTEADQRLDVELEPARQGLADLGGSIEEER